MDATMTPEQALASARWWLARAREEPDETSAKLVRRRLTEAKEDPEKIGTNEPELMLLERQGKALALCETFVDTFGGDDDPALKIAGQIIAEQLLEPPAMAEQVEKDGIQIAWQMDLLGFRLEHFGLSVPKNGTSDNSGEIIEIACAFVRFMKEARAVCLTEDVIKERWKSLTERLRALNYGPEDIAIEDDTLDDLIEETNTSRKEHDEMFREARATYCLLERHPSTAGLNRLEAALKRLGGGPVDVESSPEAFAALRRMAERMADMRLAA